MGVTLVASVLVLGFLLAVRSALFGPDDAVRRYFAALAARDADRAWAAIVDPGFHRLEAPLLQSTALRDRGYEPPRSWRLERLETDGDQGRATVGFEVTDTMGAGDHLHVTRHVVSLDLRQDRERTWLVFRGWRVQGGLYQLAVTAPFTDQIVVAGTRLSATEGGFWTIAFPGSYRVRLPDNPLIDAPPATAVPSARGDSVVLGPLTIKASGRGVMDAQVKAYLDECTKSADLSPPGCPFYSFTFGTVSDVRWRIVHYPEYTLDVTDGTVALLTTSPGLAEVTGSSMTTPSPIRIPARSRSQVR